MQQVFGHIGAFLAIKLPVVETAVAQLRALVVAKVGEISNVSQARGANVVKITGLHRSLVRTQLALALTEATETRIHEGAASIAGVGATLDDYRGISFFLLNVIRDVFRVLRSGALKLIVFRWQDVLLGHQSRVGGFFPIRGINKEEFAATLKIFEAKNITFHMTGSDGGFTWLNEQAPEALVETKAHRAPETRRTLAMTSISQAKGLIADLSARHRADPYQTPLRRQLKLRLAKYKMMFELYSTFIFRQLPDGSLLPHTPPLPNNEVVSSVDADQMWSAAGASTLLEYPVKLRCEDPEARVPDENREGADPGVQQGAGPRPDHNEAALSPGLRGLKMPFLLEADITNIFARTSGVAQSPIEEWADDEGYLEIDGELRDDDNMALDVDRAEAELRAAKPTLGPGPIDQRTLRRYALMTQAVRKTIRSGDNDERKSAREVIEKEMRWAVHESHVQERVNMGDDFDKFYYVTGNKPHFEDTPHVEKNLVHGVQRDVPAVVGELEGQGDAEDDDDLADDANFVEPRPIQQLGEELQVFSTRRMLRVAQKYAEFGPIVKTILSQADKQSVPVARLITRDRLFQAALWKHGCRREAAVLQILNGVFEAFDCGHLCPSYRDYLCTRGRWLCYRILGPDFNDPNKLAVSWGKKCGTNLQVMVLYRVLCNIDAREQLHVSLKTWVIERTLGTDDLEGFFSELTRRSGGYMPNCRVALAAARTSERALQSRWDSTWKEDISKKKRYAEYERNTRPNWNDGWRVPAFWPLERWLTPRLAADGHAPVGPDKRQKRLGEMKTKTKAQAVRDIQKNAASSRQHA